jgi:hypothetical protein
MGIPFKKVVINFIFLPLIRRIVITVIEGDIYQKSENTLIKVKPIFNNKKYENRIIKIVETFTLN